MYMPPPAMHHAMMAPNGPVPAAKVRSSEKMPAPTKAPTTVAVSANKESFCGGCDVISNPDNASRQKPASFGYGPEGNEQGKRELRLRGLHPRLLFGVLVQCTSRVHHDIG
jgi:hypothetical protein